MKVLIDIQEEMFKATQTYYSNNTTRLSIKNVIEKIASGTPIPDNATNGDVIKAMFDCQEDEKQWNDGSIWVTFKAKNNPSYNFDLEWWNAPYEGVEDGSN